MQKICTRKVDELGRIILPLKARAELGIRIKQSLDVYVSSDAILLKPNWDVPICCLCGESEVDLKEVEDLLICGDCIAKIKGILYDHQK